MTNSVNLARLVRVTASIPEICMHNVKLGPGCFCPQCPTASIEDLRGQSEPTVKHEDWCDQLCDCGAILEARNAQNRTAEPI